MKSDRLKICVGISFPSFTSPFLFKYIHRFFLGIGADEDVSASGMESGSSGSGDFLSDRDEEIRRISELQISIPYKKRKNFNERCSSSI